MGDSLVTGSVELAPLLPASGKLQLTREHSDYAPVEVAIRHGLRRPA